MPTFSFTVHGKVQGVFYRKHCCEAALSQNLCGWVANAKDGTVVGLVSGPPSSLEQFHTWLSKGSPKSRVDKVEWVEAAAEVGGGGFVVRH